MRGLLYLQDLTMITEFVKIDYTSHIFYIFNYYYYIHSVMLLYLF